MYGIAGKQKRKALSKLSYTAIPEFGNQLGPGWLTVARLKPSQSKIYSKQNVWVSTYSRDQNRVKFLLETVVKFEGFKCKKILFFAIFGPKTALEAMFLVQETPKRYKILDLGSF